MSIIDIEGGSQPVWNEDHTVAVVFNGEIYNYVELRQELSSHQFRTHSDTEVLVHAYEEFGEGLLGRLRGMFAFALFDSRRRTLLIARDHFGQKPLYYFQNGNRFGFASELKSLFTLPDCPRDQDPEAFLDYVSWMSLPPPRTHFRHIRKLQAGHRLIVPLDEPSNLSLAEYWSYDLSKPATISRMDEAVEAVEAALLDSAKVHMRADVPVGVLLSGGLDSRAITLFAQQYAGEPLHTFSVGFGNEDSELPEAENAARLLGTIHHAIQVGPREYCDSISRVARHLDEPVGDPAAMALLKVCELARSEVKVLLSGEGSDELFAGYAGRYAGMLQTQQRSNSVRWLRHWLPESPARDSSRWARLSRRVRQSPATELVLLRIEGLPGDVRSPTNFSSTQMERLYARANEFGADHYRAQRDPLSDMLVFDMRWQLAESLLQKADKMSMAASIELRTPFLDIEVAARASEIDSSLKLKKDGTGKLVLRRCMERRLPGSAALPKKGFPVPLRDWFVGPLRAALEETVLRPNSACSSYLDPRLLRRSWEDHLAGHRDNSHVFYALWLYETWRSA